MATMAERVDLLTVARNMADSLDLPPIGSKDPVYGLTPPGAAYAWLELAGRPGLAEALILALTEHLETLPGRPTALYLTSQGASVEPGYGGHTSHSIGWYANEAALLRRAIELNDHLIAAPGMFD